MATSAAGGAELVGPDFTNGLKKLGRKVEDMGATERQAADMAGQAIRRKIPRRTGNLIAHVRITDGEVAVAGVRYAGPINNGVGPRVGERGPHNIAGADFMGAGYRMTRPGIAELFQTQLEQDVSRVRNG